MAPEMLRVFNEVSTNEKFSQTKLDDFDEKIFHSKLVVFSLGLITLESIDKQNFLKHNGILNRDEGTLNNYLLDVENRKIIDDKNFLGILKEMLSFDVEKRISVEQLYDWMVR